MDCNCFGDNTEDEKLLSHYFHQKPLDDNSKMPFINSIFKDHRFEILQSFRKSEFLCDIKLETKDGNIVHGHKAILALASLYFKEMFTNIEECNKNHVYIEELDSTALQLIVDYIYTAQIIITQDNVPVLLQAANLLKIHDIQYACCAFLKTQLRPTNCLGFKKLISQYKCKEFLKSLKNYISQHFAEVIKGDEFLSLPYKALLKLISSDKLVVSEEKVFECIIEWVNHNDTNYRKQFLFILMKHVRWELLSKKYLLNIVKKEPLLLNCTKCKDYIIDALTFQILQYDQPDTILKQKCFQRPVKTLNYVSDFIPSHLLNDSAGVLDNHLYMVGGYDTLSKQFLSSVNRYCPLFGTWTSVASMNTNRFGAGVGVLNGVLYAVGGYNSESTRLNCVEVYVPSTDTWTLVSSMHKKRKNPVVFALNGLLYVNGGYFKDNQYSTTAEMYNPKTDTWTLLNNMKEIYKSN